MRYAFLAFFSWAVALAIAPVARADGPQRVVLGMTGPACAPAVPCLHASDCAAPESCQTITIAPGTTGQFCLRDVTSEIFCCSPGSGSVVCPPGSFCARVGAGAGAIPGICADTRNLCVDPTAIRDSDISSILSCFLAPVPPCVVPPPPRDLTPVPYAMGDCDGDGIANHADSSAVCTSDPPTCTPDGGAPDAAVVPDAGFTPPDAGAAPDASNVPDLGTPEQDAGTAPPDDAGMLAMDAASVPPGVSFRGGGGCNCEVGETFHGGAVTALAPLLLFWRPRRR